ncbi:UPF0481 protein At3g47200-like [Abrus precatorius]|uniref:UPF0481 protein At3g47200-like n=1 Tax=Abrus precatorius TaxID=3816 RepID=A0A8B8K4D2_ABRPR|nr:UPF0481 protein At3g47200-like [Abrus precatorius]
MPQQTQGNANNDTSWMVAIETMLDAIGHPEVQSSSISKVPDKIRKPNADAYMPRVVSIGPLHRGTKNDLLMMEPHKWSYTVNLLNQTQIPENTVVSAGPSTLENCGTDLLQLDNIVRASYGGNIHSEPHELAKVMLDGCFLLEFLQRHVETLSKGNNPNHGGDPVFQSQDMLRDILGDMLLLENQVPFIILKKLHRRIFPSVVPREQDHRVANLALAALSCPLVVSPSGVAHLLDLVHYSITNENGSHKTKQAELELNRSAMRLQAEGITIRPANSGNNNNGNAQKDNKLVNSFDFVINFENRVLEISPLHINEFKEVIWRNLIAWEQSRIEIRCKLTSYALFFQGLICCEHDIELLEHVGVIVNDSKKSKKDLEKLFRTIAEGVMYMDSCYSKTCDRLNNHKGTKPYKKWTIMAWHQCMDIFAIVVHYLITWFSLLKLIHEVFPTGWKLLGVLSGAALLGLTATQTYYIVPGHH